MSSAPPSAASQDGEASDKAACLTLSVLHSFKLLEALRSDDAAQVQPFLDDLPSSEGDKGSEAGAKLLCMAIKVSTRTSVEWLG